MNRLFITGIPTSGKSYLSRKIAEKVDGISVEFDMHREFMAADQRYAKWVNFYLDQNEEDYYSKNSPEMQWQNLVRQSEGLWPALLEKIDSYSSNEKPVIFESVNILPHLAKSDLKFPGIVLLGSSFEETLERNKAEPRWGNTPHLQELEAQCFFNVERPRYKLEAEKYAYPCFENADQAFETAIKLLQSNQ